MDTEIVLAFVIAVLCKSNNFSAFVFKISITRNHFVKNMHWNSKIHENNTFPTHRLERKSLIFRSICVNNLQQKSLVIGLVCFNNLQAKTLLFGNISVSVICPILT